MLRERAIRLAETTGIAVPLRAARSFVKPIYRYDRADHERLLGLIRQLPRDANCVDVGAYRGDVLAAIVQAAPRGSHVAFEPVPRCASVLSERFKNVDVRQKALSDRCGSAAFHVVQSGRSRLAAVGPLRRADLIEVPLGTLDTELASAYAPTLIKLDVEGSELAVLRGARETLGRYRPQVVFEQGASTPDTAGIFEFLRAFGYEVFDLLGSGPYSGASFAAAAAEDPSLINFVAKAV